MAEKNGVTIEDLKAQLNIVDVISRVVTLKRAGANYKGVCPFHNEKTPSFVVSEQKQIFTCFGCGATGDVIGFTKRFYNLDFKEACEKLAKENGIDLTFSSSKVNVEKEKHYEVNREAAKFYYSAFSESSNPGYTYMKERGLDDQTLKKFGIGYADDKWDSLYNHLKSKGFDEHILFDLGLCSRGKNNKVFDKFRNRVVFPIINTAGKVVGFQCRRINDEDNPKYMNSNESISFQKKNTLYALNTTKVDIGKEGYAILVEGNMDAISLYQHDVKNVCASCGTALTENQAKLLKKYTKNVILSYDSDDAGRHAALRGIDILAKEGIKVKVLHVPEGKDPDDYIKLRGKESFLKCIENAVPETDYKLQACEIGLDLNTDEGKVEYIKKAAQVLKSLSPAVSDIYIRKVAQSTGVSEAAIRREIDGTEIQKNETKYSKKDEGNLNTSISKLELTMFKVLLINPSLCELLLESQDIFDSDAGKKIINKAFELYGLKGNFDINEILDVFDIDESQYIKNELEKVLIAGNEEEVFKECVNTFKRNKSLEREKQIINMLSLADENENIEQIKALSSELINVQKDIIKYGGRK